MPAYRYLVFLLVLLLAAGCSTMTKDIEVTTETDPKANLSAYKTYAWLGSAQVVNDPDGQWEPPQFDADAELRFLINRELRKHGLSEVESNPDLVIAFAAGIDMQALEFMKDPDTKMQSLSNIPKGALVVIVVDPKTRTPVWAGRAKGNVQEQPTTETVKKRLDYAVVTMFKDFKIAGKKTSGGMYGY